MANREKHSIYGGASGVAVATYGARDQDLDNFLAELIGGGIGGVLGSRVPDVLEPAFHDPRHRSIAHSYTFAAYWLEVVYQNASSWQQYCRLEAERHGRIRLSSNDGWSRFWHSLMSFVWHFLSGFAVGVVAGYLSHLVLDAGTPRSIPLLA